MRRRFQALVAVFATLPLAVNASARSSDLAAGIDGYVAPLVAAEHLSGTLLVARGEEILFERSWGWADREAGRRNRPETPFAIASVTKPVTILAALRLAEQGKLDLDKPIAGWLPGFPRGEDVLVKHLLWHRSGLPHRVTEPEDEAVRRSAADMVALAREVELAFEPGSDRLYSSTGYAVLARILELSVGVSYAELVRDLVLAPVRAGRTTDATSGPPGAAALAYVLTAQGWRRAPAKDLSFLVGGGSLYSTPRDLHRIALALDRGVFGQRARANLVRFGKLEWGGFSNGYQAFLDYDSATGLTVALTANLHTGAAERIRRAVPRIAAGEEVEPEPPPEIDPIDLQPARLQRLTGLFAPAEGAEPFELRLRDGSLLVNEWPLVPVAETRFFVPQSYAFLSFTLGDDGGAVAATWEADGSSSRWKRLGDLDDR